MGVLGPAPQQHKAMGVLGPALPQHKATGRGNSRIFHSMEKLFGVFPYNGKKFSTLWKKPAGFSTPGKKFPGFFHAMEKSFPRYGKLLLALLLVGGLAVAGAGCATVKKSRLAVPKAVHWRATASAAAEDHGPQQAIDGNLETWWRSGPEEPQWLELDLARPAMVCGFSLQWGAPHATAYSVLTSPDGTHWALGYETAGGDGDWDQASLEPIFARYIRLVVDQGAEGNGAALRALEIKGLEDQPRAWVDGAAEPEAAALLDGDRATAWRSARPAATVELDLRTVKPVGSVRLDWGPNGFASNTVVELSTNRLDWVSMGRVQARSGDFDVLMHEDVQPAQYVRLSFSGASAAAGFEVAGVTLRGAEGAARPWSLYELAAAKAPEGVYPSAFRRQATSWAVAAGPRRGDAESLLDEQGVFAPAVHGPTLAPLLVAGGQVFTARQAREVEYRLAGAHAPMPETDWKLESGLVLRIRAMARSGAEAATSWAEYELANESIMAQTGRLCWVVRPVRLAAPRTRGGLAPIYKLRAGGVAGGWQELRVNDAPLFAVPDTNLPFGAAAVQAGDVTEFFLRGETPGLRAAADDDGLASGAWWLDFALEPGQKVRMVVAANAQPEEAAARKFAWPALDGGAEKAADAFAREWLEATWLWRDLTSGYAPKIDRPDAVNCLQAQVGWLLGVRTLAAEGGGEDVDALRLRAAALLRAGRPEAAREWIERVAAGIQTNGRVPARYRADGTPAVPLTPEARHDAQGQFAFMVLEYFRFTQDTSFLQAQYAQLHRALEYLQGLRAGLEKLEWKLPEEERVLVEGLLPLSGPRFGRSKPAHLYADHYWALLAWKEMRTAAALLGLDQDAAWADEQYRTLKSAVQRSLRERMDRMEGMWIPASAEEERLDPEAVALLVWPCAETDLVEPHELQTSLDLFYEDFLERSQPGWTGSISSSESQLLVPLASMGRGDYVREVLYGLLDRRHPRGWQAWPETTGQAPLPPGMTGPMPDIRAAASYFIAARGLAARESGKRLDLFCGAPAEWLQHGSGYRVYGMPTEFGPLDLSGDWEKDRLVVEIGGSAQPPEGYRLWWPRQIAPQRVLLNGQHLREFNAQWADLPHDFKGRVEVTFPYLAPWPREP